MGNRRRQRCHQGGGLEGGVGGSGVFGGCDGGGVKADGGVPVGVEFDVGGGPVGGNGGGVFV